MSRPFQFTDKDDISNSPLDRRQQNPFPPGQQPPSFKTNVNRAKTKKWVEAKQVSYGGDDWDDYDEDDEYGVSSAVETRPPPAFESVPPQSRSFTTPIPGTAQQLERSNSFERGDERRAFSSSTHPAPAAPPRSPGPPLHVDTAVPVQQQPVTEDTSASQYSQSAGGARQVSAHSFAPSVASDNSVNPENRRDFSPTAMPPPLRTPATAMSPTDTQTPLSPASAAKARTFVRPADIYKRMEEERENQRRASLESTSRRSMDSNRSAEPPVPAKAPEPVPTAPVPQPKAAPAYEMGAPLETVAERKSEYGMPGFAPSGPSSTNQPGFSGLSLPALESNAGFGDFWDDAACAKEAEKSASAAAAPPSSTQPTDANLQHQPSVGYRSIVNQAFDAQTHISKQNSTRSQAATESSGITRSDTTGTSDISPIISPATGSAQHQPATIAEEPEFDERGRAVRKSAESTAPADFQPGYRRSLNPPSGTNSPARSPIMEHRNPLAGPAVAEVLTSPASDKAETPSALQTYDLPNEASSNIARAESPTKGRVADLAGKFSEVATPDSRRNSTQSIGSKKSASSLKDPSSRPTSSHDAPRPVAEREISFRPKLPGGFESYASTADVRGSRDASPAKQEVEEEQAKPSPPTAKSVPVSKGSGSATGPMAALAAAGAAIAASIQGATSGSDDKDDDEEHHGRATGDIYNRPLPPDRLESTASTIPPTPLPKDEPMGSALPPLLTKDLPQPPKLEHRDTADTTASADFESDRLRRDIVRTLSPTDASAPGLPPPAPSTAAGGLEVPQNRAPNREGGTILSEYERYWAGDEDENDEGPPTMSATILPSVAPAPLKMTKSAEAPVPAPAPAPIVEKTSETPVAAPVPIAPSPVVAPPAAPVPASATLSDSPASARPGFLTQRFSWEMTPADSPVKEDPMGAAKVPEQPAPTSVPAPAPVPAKDALKPADPLSLNPKLSSEHLQIRNAEPGDLPEPEPEVPRGPSLDSIREREARRESTPRPMNIDGPISPLVDPPISPIVPTATAHREAPLGPRPLSGGKDIRPPSFREILAIKSTDLRIAKYNETRLQFAGMDTGLQHWLHQTTLANPEIRDLNTHAPTPLTARPTLPNPTITTSSPTGGRHKATASLTKVFSGQGDKLSPSTPVESGSGSSPSASAAALKGKEFINKAGVLGGKGLGKGMKEAKGLFAKGKSRFGGRMSGGGEKVLTSPSPFEPSYLCRRNSSASFSSSRSRTSSVFDSFSVSSSRRSSLDTTPPASRRVSLDTLSIPVTSQYSSSSPINELTSTSKGRPELKKLYDEDDDEDNRFRNDDDDEPLWSESWLRENVDFTVMAIWNRKKEAKPVFGQPDAEENEEVARNTKLNAARPVTPRQGGQPFLKLGGEISNSGAPALPNFTFESRPGSRSGSRPASRNGPSPDPAAMGRGIMKHSNSSQNLLGGPGAGRSVSSPLAVPSGPALKMGDRNSNARIVSMLAPSEAQGRPGSHSGDEDDPPSPVSPVDEDEQANKFPPNGKDALGRSANLRATSSNPRLPSLNTQSQTNMLAPTISMGSPMLRPNSHIGIGAVDSPSSGRPRVSFAPPEPKGKEKAVSGTSTPTSKHARFDSSTFPDKDKDGKAEKGKGMAKDVADKPAGGKKFAPSLIIPRFGGGRGRGGSGTSTPTDGRSASLPPPAAPALKPSRPNQPETGQFLRPNGPETGQLRPAGNLRRADSQFDRMAAIANAHRLMREQFDEMNGVAAPPPDLMASEAAARVVAEGGGESRPVNGLQHIQSIPEERPTSSDTRSGRSRASSITSEARDERSRSRESRPSGLHAPKESRSSSMPRIVPGGGARASSIPRPESIVGAPGGRRQSWGSGPTSPGGSNIGVAVSTPMLTISKGQTPVTTVSSQSFGRASPQQGRRGSGDPRLSAGPGPTLRNDGGRSGASTPSMVITSPDMVSTATNASPPKKAGARSSLGAQSYNSIPSMGDSVDRSNNASPVPKGLEARSKHSGGHERPMSYVMLARDDRGIPVSETISTARNAIDGATSEADEDDATSAAEPAKDQKTLNRLIGESNSGQTSRSSMRSDDDDELYKQPSPKVSEQALAQKASGEQRTSTSGKHRSVQLYDRPFSRDESASAASGTSTPSHHSQAPSHNSQATSQASQAQQIGPDANPLVQSQGSNTPVAAKKGLLAKIKGGKPASVASVVASGHSQNSSRDTTNTSSEEQRLSSMTSTTASIQSDAKEKRGKRGSGLFGLRRPSSTEPIMVQDDSVIPPHNQVRINTNVAAVASPASSTASTPRRSATSVEPSKKRRGTFSNIFSRGGPPPKEAAPPVPQKPSAKSTIFHRVPANPPAQPDNQRFTGPRDLHSAQGKTSSEQDSRPPSASGRRPPSFSHEPGASGMSAIDALRKPQVTTTITGGGKEKRSMSLTGSGGLFGRKRTDASPSSTNRDRSNSVESTMSSKLKKGRRSSKGSHGGGPIMQHQERPWAITLPGAEDDEQSKAIERAEIMQAATERWQRGSDGQMYQLTDPSPQSAVAQTPISPQLTQTIPPIQQSSHAPAPAPAPVNPNYGYQPAGAPGQQRTPPYVRGPEPSDYYSMRTTGSAPTQRYPPQPQRMGHMMNAQNLSGYQSPGGYNPGAPSPPTQTVIPPMPQANLPLIQPQPRRGSAQADVNDPRLDSSYRSTGRAPSSASPQDVRTPNSSAPRSPRSQAAGEAHFPRPKTGDAQPGQNQGSRDGRPASRPVQQERRPSVPMKDPPRSPQRRLQSRGSNDSDEGAVASQNFVAALEAERRKHGDHTGMGPSVSTRAKRAGAGLHVAVPVTSGAPPPQVGVFSDTTAAVASTGLGARRSQRGRDEQSDDESAPVMKATSFPGDEWVPEFYYE